MNDLLFGVGLALFAVELSVAIDLSPIGRVRGITEAVIGYDLLTGERLTAAERMTGLIPGGRGARAVDGVADAGGTALRQTGGDLRRVRSNDDFETEWADDAYEAIRRSDDVDAVATTAAQYGFLASRSRRSGLTFSKRNTSSTATLIWENWRR